MTTRLGWFVAAAAAVVLAMAPLGPVAAADSVDEIHWSYGDDRGEVTLNWRGTETTLYYGLTDHYGSTAVATESAITPVDRVGPFQEVRLSGLAPDTAYHYRIGAQGADHVLRTAPLGSFRWVDVGDTASSLCKPWVTQVHELIDRLAPRFVTHGGDISEANVCGVEAVHRYYTDQQVWAEEAAFQPVWGNHEYGPPVVGAPAGTPRDSLANYKGRGRLSHPQTVSADAPTRTGPPGCGTGTVNTCRGEDWGWFRAGGVLFVSYPEIWPDALADWSTVATGLLADAQADPTVDFVVTYGHRPAYSSQVTNGWDPTVRAALDPLARRYSPRLDNPDGKYVLNLAHHVHALEVFRPIDGLTHVTNATGGQGQVTLSTPDPASVLRFRHPGVIAGDYDAAARQLTLRWVCGPVYSPGPKEVCGYGDTVWQTTFTAGTPATPSPDPGPGPTPSPGVTPSPSPTSSHLPSTGPGGSPSPDPSPVPSPTGTAPGREWVLNRGAEKDLAGWTGRYGSSPYVTVARSTTDVPRTGTAVFRVTAGSGAKDLTSGFNDNPRWAQRVTRGAVFTASAWVRPKLAGQEIVLRLREWTSTNGLVTDRITTFAMVAGWQRVAVPLTVARDGTSLSVALYAKDLDAGEFFLADDLSLTS